MWISTIHYLAITLSGLSSILIVDVDESSISGFTTDRNLQTENFAILGELVESAWPFLKRADK